MSFKRYIVEEMVEADLQVELPPAPGTDAAPGDIEHFRRHSKEKVIEALGELTMWKLAIRPGKPLAFGRIDDTPFIGTPGNPVALFVTFLLFARPFILKRMGVADCLPKPVEAIAGFEWSKPDKRREFHRAKLERTEDGGSRVIVHPSRSSGVLSSVTWADGLVVIPEGQKIKPGDKVEYLAFGELVT